jgi:two-component system sensor histidine kinase FlrB
VASAGDSPRLAGRFSPAGADEILMLADASGSRQTAEFLQRDARLSAMGEMLAKLAHQIRTPLASALLYARQIESDAGANSHSAGRICDRLNDIDRMIDDLLVYAAGSRGDTERFSVRELYEDVVEESQGLHAGRLPRMAMSRDDLFVEGTRGAIKGAILNLVDNAYQACGECGRVELGAELTKDRICLTVSDDGPGISADIKDRLFEPFFTTRPQGTGLGLAIVRAVIEAHAGDVIVDSSSQGTTVALCFRAPQGRA